LTNSATRDDEIIRLLAKAAPGTALREGLERILRGETGGLIVLGENPVVQSVLSGGFRIDVAFTAQRLSELAKLDGAIVVDERVERILWANVHLMPDGTIPTEETGTRHRTAERVATQTKVPVVAVSQSMHIVTLYLDGARRVLDDSGSVLSRANQAMQTLERYRFRFDQVATSLTALEVEDAVTQRDVLGVLQRGEMVRRIAEEIERYIAELGTDGRLLQLQLDELMGGVADELTLVARDYFEARRGRAWGTLLTKLALLEPGQLWDPGVVAAAVDGPFAPDRLDDSLSPHGYRMLAKIPRLPAAVIANLVHRFPTLQALMEASLEELDDVDGVGATRARLIRDGLSRQAETSVLERYA
jgi:diadenylate cyclase